MLTYTEASVNWGLRKVGECPPSLFVHLLELAALPLGPSSGGLHCCRGPVPLVGAQGA